MKSTLEHWCRCSGDAGGRRCLPPPCPPPLSAPASRHLHIPLVQAERAWAYAMDLKSQLEQKAEASTRHHLIRRLAKAAQHAGELAALAAQRCDARTQVGGVGVLGTASHKCACCVWLGIWVTPADAACSWSRRPTRCGWRAACCWRRRVTGRGQRRASFGPGALLLAGGRTAGSRWVRHPRDARMCVGVRVCPGGRFCRAQACNLTVPLLHRVVLLPPLQQQEALRGARQGGQL